MSCTELCSDCVELFTLLHLIIYQSESRISDAPKGDAWVVVQIGFDVLD